MPQAHSASRAEPAARLDPRARAQAQLKLKRPVVAQCLQLGQGDGDVSLTVHVSRRGALAWLVIAEPLAPGTFVCICGALARVDYPEAMHDYQLTHTFHR